MACCKCCCGGENCTEGQEGKCCCGGSEGSCCQPGEYCCSGVCEPAPCSTGCCCFCGTPNEEYGDQGSCEAAGGTWLEGESCTPNPCTDTPCIADGQCVICVRVDPPDSVVINYEDCDCPDGYTLADSPAVCCGGQCVAPPSTCPGKCDPANGDPEYYGSYNNTDCYPGECCIDLTCVSGCSCESNADCNGGYCCDGACQATECEEPCDQYGDCPSGECCIDGVCLVCPECDETVDCPTGYCCVSGECVACSECESESDCNGANCCDGTCKLEPCTGRCCECGSPGESLVYPMPVGSYFCDPPTDFVDCVNEVLTQIKAAYGDNGYIDTYKETVSSPGPYTSSDCFCGGELVESCEGCEETCVGSPSVCEGCDYYDITDNAVAGGNCKGRIDYDNPISVEFTGIAADCIPANPSFTVYPCVQDGDCDGNYAGCTDGVTPESCGNDEYTPGAVCGDPYDCTTEPPP